MSRYIDADRLAKRLTDLHDWCRDERKKGLEQSICIVHEQPTADVVEVRHGRWLPIIERSGYLDPPYYDTGKCSSCSYVADVSEMRYKYCPCCGAKMDGERSENGT